MYHITQEDASNQDCSINQRTPRQRKTLEVIDWECDVGTDSNDYIKKWRIRKVQAWELSETFCVNTLHLLSRNINVSLSQLCNEYCQKQVAFSQQQLGNIRRGAEPMKHWISYTFDRKEVIYSRLQCVLNGNNKVNIPTFWDMGRVVCIWTYVHLLR
jgi:hypothetical protein